MTATKRLMFVDDETGEYIEVAQKAKRKWKENFFMTDQRSAVGIASDKGLNGTDMRVLWFLLGNIDYNNIAVVTQAFISGKIGTQQSLVSQSLKKLAQKNYIEKISFNGTGAYLVNKQFAQKGNEKK